MTIGRRATKQQTTSMISCLPVRALPGDLGRICHRLFIAISMLVVLCCTETRSARPEHAWRIDETQTVIGFKIEAAGFPTTRGRFNHYTGRILIDFEHPAKSFASFTVDSASVDLGSPSFNDFVKSPVLLNADRFPTLSFTSTVVEKLDARTARVTGSLMMLRVWRRVDLDQRGPRRHGCCPWCREPYVHLLGMPCHRASGSVHQSWSRD